MPNCLHVVNVSYFSYKFVSSWSSAFFMCMNCLKSSTLHNDTPSAIWCKIEIASPIWRRHLNVTGPAELATVTSPRGFYLPLCDASVTPLLLGDHFRYEEADGEVLGEIVMLNGE